jgi:Tol biopolymer transport system component
MRASERLLRLSLPIVLVLATTALGDVTQVTEGGGGWTRPSVDAKGKMLVCINGGNLYLQDLKKRTAVFIAADADEACISANGKFVAYSSDGNPLGTNPDGNQEIFLYDVKLATTKQITTTIDDFECGSPSIDKKGRWIVFVTDADLLGTNPDENEEVYLYDVVGNRFVQVTQTSDSFDSPEHPVIVPNGKHVLFDSEANHAGRNGDRNREIFRYEIATGVTEQLTVTTTGDSERPVPNKNGKYVCFQTDCLELIGVNTDGRDEIVRMDTRKGTFLRLTDGSAACTRPATSGNGKYVAFQSRGDPLGTNADGSEELFLVKVKKAPAPTPLQISDGSFPHESERASLNTSGKRVFFQSDADLVGNGSGTDQVFQYVR